MINSKYAPINVGEYGTKDLNLNYQGTSGTVPKGTTTNIDFLITGDHLVDGGEIISSGAVMGDKFTIMIVDKDNVLGYGLNVVLNQFITNWFVDPVSPRWGFTSSYPAKLYSGLYVRLIFTSIGTVNDVTVAINMGLHKVLW